MLTMYMFATTDTIGKRKTSIVNSIDFELRAYALRAEKTESRMGITTRIN